MEWDPWGNPGHVVPGVSKILLIRATAHEDHFHNSGELRVYREAQTDIPDPLFIPDKSAWPRLPLPHFRDERRELPLSRVDEIQEESEIGVKSKLPLLSRAAILRTKGGQN